MVPKTYQIACLLFSVSFCLICICGCAQPTDSTAAPATEQADSEAAPPAKPPDRPVTLDLRLPPGLRYSRRVRLVSDFKVPIAPNADFQTTNMLLDYHVADVDKDGNTTLEVTIAGIKAEARSFQFSFAYDSDTDTGPPDRQTDKDGKKQKYYRSFANLKGARYSALIDPTGRVVNLLNMSDRLKDIVAGKSAGHMLGGDQVSVVLSQSNLREWALLGVFASMPDGEVEIGQTWPGENTIDIPRATALTSRTYRLDSVEQVDGQQHAAISYEIKMAQPDKAATSPARSRSGLQIVSVVGSGKILFSVTQGRLVSLTEVFRAGVTAGGTLPKDAKPKSAYVVTRTIEYADEQP